MQPATRSALAAALRVAVEVSGSEWSYGWSDTDEIGIFSHEPRKCPQHRFVQAIYLGDCKKTPQELENYGKLWKTMENCKLERVLASMGTHWALAWKF